MKNYNRNNHRQFSNLGVQRYNTPRPQYNPNQIEVKRDGSYKGDVSNLNHALTAMGWFVGILGALGFFLKSKFNNSEDKRKLEYEQQMSNIREAEHQRDYARKVVYEQQMSNIRTDEFRKKSNIRVDEFLRKHPFPTPPNSQSANPYVEDAEVIEEMPASSDASTSVPTDGISSDELFSSCSTEPDNIWIVDGYMAKGLVNLLVAGGGKGKSILMTQIALAVAKGERPEFLPDTCQKSCKQPVVFYRIEHFPNELKGKYGEGKVFEGSGINWVLPENLSSKTLSGFLEHLYGLAQKISSDALVCADPATKLDGYNHEDFIRGVEEAQEIAKANGHTLTILASIHADETEDWKPFSSCNIKGGDKGFQQAGSAAVLRKERRGEEYRYLQCLKEPKGSPKPFDGKFLVMKKEKTQLDSKNSYLHFVYVDEKEEAEALPPKPKAQATAPVTPNATSPSPQKKAPHQKVTLEMVQKMMEMHAKGKTQEEIAKELEVCPKTVSTYLKAFEAQKPDKH